MKRIVLGIAGLTAAAVGLIGVVLSGVAIHQVWMTAEHVGHEVSAAIAQLEMIVGSVHQQSAATVGVLVTARERVSSIRSLMEELARQSEQRPTIARILESLEQDIGHRLEDADSFVVSMQASLRSMSSDFVAAGFRAVVLAASHSCRAATGKPFDRRGRWSGPNGRSAGPGHRDHHQDSL